MADASPLINLRSREVDPRNKTSSSVPPTSRYIYSSDGKRFHDNAEGAVRFASHSHFLAVCKRSGISSPPPLQKNLFPPDLGLDEVRDGHEVEMLKMAKQMQHMTEELERSRALMDLKMADLQTREDRLQATIQDSVNQALEAYALNNPPTPSPSPTAVSDPVPVATSVRSENSGVHDSQSAIQMICGSSNILARLMSKFKLPSIYKDERHEVASVIDLYHRSVRKYDKLADVFNGSLDGADLILAVQKFRDLMESYKEGIGPELLDWLTLYAVSCQSDVLHDKVAASLEVACSIRFVDRQTVFNEMMSSGVLPEVSTKQTDILHTVGAKELIASNCSTLALKSVCNFVVSYCGHFADILSKALKAEKEYKDMRFADTEDCQALFSAELKAYNQVMVWFGGDFMLPLMRARLFISKCPPHVKKQYAEDCDLRVGMTWQQFKQKMAQNWAVAFKKASHDDRNWCWSKGRFRS
jgi:hypothetical protein